MWAEGPFEGSKCPSAFIHLEKGDREAEAMIRAVGWEYGSMTWKTNWWYHGECCMSRVRVRVVLWRRGNHIQA